MAVNVGIVGIVTLVILLAQNSAAKPLPEVEMSCLGKYEQLLNEIIEDNNAKVLTPKEQLVLFALNQFNELATFFEKESTRLVELSAKDEKIVSSEETEVQQFKERLENYLKAVEKAEKFEDRIDVMELFSKLVEPYEIEEKTDPTENEKLIAGVLDEHGLGQLNHDFGVRFIDGFDEIAAEFVKYLKTLNEEELKELKLYTDFMDNLKAKKTNEEKLQFLFEFADDNQESKEEKK